MEKILITETADFVVVYLAERYVVKSYNFVTFDNYSPNYNIVITRDQIKN